MMRLLRFLPRFREAYRSLETLAAREAWTRSEIEAFQLERLNAIWRDACAYVPYYRELKSRHGLPPRFISLTEFQAVVPLLSKAAIMADSRSLLSAKASHGQWKLTGGSTGLPTPVYWEHRAHLEVLRFRYRHFAMWGVDIFDRIAFLWGHGASFAPGWAGRVARWRQPWEDWLRNRIRLSAYHVGPNDLRKYLARIARFRPAAIYAYSTAMYLLAQQAESQGFHLDSLRIAVLTSEPAPPHVIETVERTFRIPALIEYGSVECGVMAGTWTDRTLRVREDGVLMETVPRDDGRFDIVVTILTNPCFPLIRYAIGDITDTPLERPPRGFAFLKNITGRSNDVLITRGGRRIHPHMVMHCIEKTPGVRLYSAHQLADGSLSVAVQPNEQGTPLDTALLERRIRDLSFDYSIRIEVVNEIEQTRAGKHRWIFSDFAGR